VDPPCARACPEDALVFRKGGGVLLKTERCTGCGTCVKACIVDAVFWDDDNNKPLICWHCGFCAKHCPYGVIGLVKSEGGGQS
jgi:Fe-S-cluster-containing hydrogenase component 2